ncbi:MAG TPA: hypothetical protein VNI01_11055, partial [Elusimicrobiota bacterium]|nr:hypothetical protein [Elusimicrobiota bacterium]
MTAGLLLAALLAFGARAAPAAAADARRTLDFGGLEREYFLHVPPAYDGKKALPLVLMLHGGGGPASSIMQSSGMSAI